MCETANGNEVKSFENLGNCPECSQSREFVEIRELLGPTKTADKEFWILCKCHRCGNRFVQHMWWDYTTDEDGRPVVRAFSTGYVPIEDYLRIHSVKYDERNDCNNCAHSKYFFTERRDWQGTYKMHASHRCTLLNVSCEDRQQLPGQCPRWARPRRA